MSRAVLGLDANHCGGCSGRRDTLNAWAPYDANVWWNRLAATVNQLSPGKQMLEIAKTRRLLLRFHRGLGDSVQATVMVQHIQHHHPDIDLHLSVAPGTETVFRGLCHAYQVGINEPPFDQFDHVANLDFDGPGGHYSHHPGLRAIDEIFRLPRVDSLCRCKIAFNDVDRATAAKYLDTIADRGDNGRYPVALIHYQGNSNADRKCIDENIIRAAIGQLQRAGLVVVLLDFDGRSGLLEMPGVRNPRLDNFAERQDAPILAAMIDQATHMVGIDSGPGHIAGTTSTPTLILWDRHSPVSYYGLSPNVLHVVRSNHADFIHGDRLRGEQYFAEKYNHYVCAKNLRDELPWLIERMLADPAGMLRTHAPLVRSATLHADTDVEREVIWQDCYRTAEFASIVGRPQFVIDVGANIGAFARRVRPYCVNGAMIVCVEADPANVDQLRENVAAVGHVEPSACSYEAAELQLFSTVGSNNRGGSYVAGGSNGGYEAKPTATVEAITLESLLTFYDLPRIDVLKLDCEGSEFSILENATCLDRVRLVVGEWHDRERFMDLVDRKFSTWQLRILKDGPLGLFWLLNPQDADMALAA